MGRLWPGTIPMESPSRATYDKLQVRAHSGWPQCGSLLGGSRSWPAGAAVINSNAIAAQADPALVERDAEALAEFEAAPWLLPTRSKVLPYAGVHDLERLLKIRSTAIGPYNKTITVVLFSKNASVMAQNASEHAGQRASETGCRVGRGCGGRQGAARLASRPPPMAHGGKVGSGRLKPHSPAIQPGEHSTAADCSRCFTP